jgi:methylmalonyl-CoA/ethylmalonyl-CoA epimerase
MTEPVIRGLSHIAIAVTSFACIEKWLSFFPVEKITKYSSEEQRVNAVVVHLEDFDIEFLEPTTESSSISGFLEKNPRGGLHHVCFYVDNLKSSLSRVKKEGVRSITLRKALGVIHDSPIAFLNPKDLSGVLVEFEELGKDEF